MALLEDRFRLWATVACYGGAYLLSLAVGWAVRALLGPTWAVAAGALVLFGASLFLSRNGLLDKLYLAILALSNTLYLEAFLPLLLGTLPFSTAGAFAAVASLAATLLLTALMGLCLYRPFRHFSGRGPSAFLAGMCLLQLAACGVSNGRVDFLFRAHIPAERLLAATLLYLAVLFAFRSVYQAGRYSQRVAEEAARSTMLETIRQDYIRTARAKGLRERVVIIHHALKNALIPIVTVIGMELGGLFSGSVLVETIFAWPGVGKYIVDGINNSDYAVVQGGCVLVAVIAVGMNLVVDLLYGLLDPRIRY